MSLLRTSSWIRDFGRDLRYATRALARSPSFSVTVVVTLALGIGGAALMFSVINGVLLRPLPYPNQDRLVEIAHAAPALGFGTLYASPAMYFTYRDHNESFDSIGLWDWDSSPATVVRSEEPESVQSVEVTHEVLGILGASAELGRTFTDADGLPESPATVVLSHAFSRRHFGETSPVGQTLRVDGIVREVIGVLPESFTFFDYPAEIYYPLQPRRSTAVFPSFDGRAIAKLKEGVTVEQANADVGRMIPMLSTEFPSPPGLNLPDFDLEPTLQPLKDSVVGALVGTLWTLMGTVVALLLIACANVANLILVRTDARWREFAIRAALGAALGGVARVVLSEAAVLTLIAGALGLGITYAAWLVLINASAIDLPQVMRVEIDPTVLLFATVVVAILMAVLTMVPMVQLRYARHSVALHAGGRSIGVERGRARTRHSLLVAQVALALLLLVGSGLMVRTFAALRDVDPGFRNPEAVQTFQIALSEADAGTIDEAVRMQQTIAEGLAAIPGVEQAAFAAFNDGLPMDGDGRSGPMYIQGRSTTDEPPPSREIGFVSPEFFATLVTPLLAGRTFTWDDIYSRQPVTVVSENLARSEWGSAEAALGRQIGFGPSGPWFEVVGVVKDLRYNGLSSPAPESAVFPIVTAGDRPGGSRFATYLVRSDRAGTAALLAEIQQAVGAVSSNVAVANARTLGALYERSMSRTSLALLVLVSTGSIALLLGLVGIYGVYSYAVSLRRREIAIRAALGAQQSQLRRMFLTHAVVLTGIGVVIGIGIAMALTQYISSQLFGVSPLDPVTYAASALVLVTTGAIAAYLPARRASELDPQAVLASE